MLLWPFHFMKVAFMGTPQAAVPTLERLVADGHEVAAVYSQPDRPSGRGNNITFSAVKQFALDNGLVVLQPAKIKTPEAQQEFRSHGADVAVVVAYGRILPEAFLSAFPLGAINVHFSMLPKYRGAAPVNWAIANGETVTGVTTMKMDAELDTGDILLQREVGISSDETAPELMESLSLVGAALMSETLATFSTIEARPQEHQNATYAPILSRVEGRIDWNLSANDIVNRVRGFQPFPSSYSFLDGIKVTIWKAAIGEPVDANPGTVVEIERGAFAIACGSSSSVRVLEIQPEGKRRRSAADFVNGMRLQIGDVFGT